MPEQKKSDLKLVEPSPADSSAMLAAALRTLDMEAQGLSALRAALEDGLGAPFAAAARAIREAEGRVIVTGMGKSGHIGRKIAATLSSTGTPAFFVHPGEASHGDLGMIRPRQDVVLALSWSGETVELMNLVDYSRRFKVTLIAMTSNAASALARTADVALVLPATAEACPHGLAPTTSTLVQLALGDALAVALLESRGFTAKDFKDFHPGGQLGASLKSVRELMHSGAQLPLVPPETGMREALVTMTEKSFGCLGVVTPEGRLAGIVTDGDLRRHISSDLLELTVADIMTENPQTVPPDLLAAAALEMLNARRITALFVVEDGKPAGLVHIHDFLRAGVA